MLAVNPQRRDCGGWGNRLRPSSRERRGGPPVAFIAVSSKARTVSGCSPTAGAAGRTLALGAAVAAGIVPGAATLPTQTHWLQLPSGPVHDGGDR